MACNEFTEMPKGQIAISFEGRTQMNELMPASGAEAEYLQRADNLIFRFKKQVANDGEVIFYELKESQLEQDIYFNTVYFDC